MSVLKPLTMQESEVVYMEDDPESSSEFDVRELNHRNIGEEFALKRKRFASRTGEVINVEHLMCDESRQCVSNFETVHGSIPSSITCSSISVSKIDFLTVLRASSWVSDSPITAFMMLLSQRTTSALDALFFTFLREFATKHEARSHTNFSSTLPKEL